MKKFVISLLLTIVAITAFTQTPQSFKYQAVLRNTQGNILENQNVLLKISILSGSEAGNTVYSEEHELSTSAQGLIVLNIGNGEALSGTFNEINWGTTTHFLKLELDYNNSGYTEMGTTPLLSVPYALHAETVSNVNDADADPNNEIQTLSISGDTIYLSNGGSIVIQQPETFSGNYNDLTNAPTPGGDASGRIDNLSINKIKGMEVSSNIPANGQVLKWNESEQKWMPDEDGLGAAGTMDGVVSSVGIEGESTKTMTFTRSNGLGALTANFNVDDADADPTNEIQKITYSNDTLYLSDGGAVKIETGAGFSGSYNDLSDLPSDLDTNASDDFSGDYNDLSNKPMLKGDVTGEMDSTVVTRIQGQNFSAGQPENGQVLKWNGSAWAPGSDAVVGGSGTDGVVETLSVTTEGNTKTITVGLSSSAPSQNLNANFTDEVNDADADATNEIQDISLSGTNLSITNGSTVDLATLQDGTGTDEQGLILTGDVLSIENGNGSIDLSTYIDDADADDQNEIQDLTITGNKLKITGNNNATEIDLSAYLDNTDTTLNELEVDAFVANNGYQFEVDDKDTDATNELQKLSLIGNTLSLDKDGGNITLPSKGWEGITDALFAVTKPNGDTVFAVYESGVRIYVDESSIKAAKGGFAVASRSAAKGITSNILNVTSDSVRIYLDESSEKAAKGGFAVASRSAAKGSYEDILNITSDSVRVYLDESTGKAAKGGFAVASRSATKGSYEDILNINPDSVRVYIDDQSSGKRAKGGFAVASRSAAKNGSSDILSVTSDSTRIYLNESSNKAAKGGFAVASRSAAKSNSEKSYFNINTSTNPEIVNNESRIIFYPTKDAFMAGTIIIPSPDSVGQNSANIGFGNTAKGQYSQAFGYQSTARGNYSMAVGKNALAASENAFAFGEDAKAFSNESYAFGRGATASGYRSFAFGSAGIDSIGNPTAITQAKGDYSFAIGQGSITGLELEECPIKPNKFTGTQEAYWQQYYSGLGALAIGVGDSAAANYSTAIGYYNTAAYGSVALGYQNKARGFTSTIAGGKYNIITGGSSTIAGGFVNNVEAVYAAILGGSKNDIYSGASWGVIGGGYENEITGTGGGAIVAGTRNSVSNSAFIGGGSYNIASNNSVITGGQSNANTGSYGFIGGGKSNNCSANYGFIGGGNNNSNTGTSLFGYGIIVGGEFNYNTGDFGFIGGGESNGNNGEHGFVGGGEANKVENTHSVVTGGYDNDNYGYYSFIGGGHSNYIAEKSYGIICGGRENRVASTYGSVISGYNNVVRSTYETVLGRYNDTTMATSTSSWVSTDPLFTIGNGSSTSNRSNALVVYKNGNLDVNGSQFKIESKTDATLILKADSDNSNEYDNPRIEFIQDGGLFSGGIGFEGDAGSIYTNSLSNSLYLISNNSSPLQLGTNNQANLTIDTGGDIGIGTTNPGNHKLHVKGGTSGTGLANSTFIATNTSAGIAGTFENTDPTNDELAALIVTHGTGDILRLDSYHGIDKWDDEFRFTNDGIGYADGSWQGGGADFAEYFVTVQDSTKYSPGDIMIIGSNDYSADISKDVYSPKILGVYSDNPAIVGNSNMNNNNKKVLVGLIGVVETNVSNENGTIKIGDFVTTSSKQGVGMKATESGMVVGRALEPLTKDNDKIKIFVNVHWAELSLKSENETLSAKTANLESKVNKLENELEQLKQMILEMNK